MKRSIFVAFMAEKRALMTFARCASFELATGLAWGDTKTTPEQA